jgi:hypothetical protein
MDPSAWGPVAWDFLHTVTFGYPEKPTNEQKQSAVAMFRSLQDLLPCSVCQNHFRGILARFPIENHIHSRDALSKWLYTVHNIVNRDLKKTIQIPFHEVERKYNTRRSWITRAEETLRWAPEDHLLHMEKAVFLERKRRQAQATVLPLLQHEYIDQHNATREIHELWRPTHAITPNYGKLLPDV